MTTRTVTFVHCCTNTPRTSEGVVVNGYVVVRCACGDSVFVLPHDGDPT